MAETAREVAGEPHSPVTSRPQGSSSRPPALRGPFTPASALWLQRAAGNTAVARLLAHRAGRRSVQRDCSGACGCADCGSQEVVPPLAAPSSAQGTPSGAVELDDRKKKTSVRKGPACDPARTIQGVLFVPSRPDEVDVAKKAVEGSKTALAKQNIVLDLDVNQFLELDALDITDKDGMRSVSSYAKVCVMMHELAFRRQKSGVVVLMVPISGELCDGHGSACYVPDFSSRCPSSPIGLGRIPDKLIILGRFTPGPTTLAHELGHHAGAPQPRDPTTFGHEPYDRRNYMGFDADRDHYRNELLDRMCSISFQF